MGNSTLAFLSYKVLLSQKVTHGIQGVKQTKMRKPGQTLGEHASLPLCAVP